MNVDIHTLEKQDDHYPEHKRAVQRGDTIIMDLPTNMHSINWENAKILELNNNC